MIKIQDISLKFKYILKSEAFQKQPLTILFRLTLLLLALFLRKNLNYKVFFAINLLLFIHLKVILNQA